ncbi:hypothetical protein [Asticcacaulis excentricus]|uniref:hypothetical protein n=1 Tax=Asticcacaulis excentricus TaxID=78587 RepID=UPI000F83477A|nr:hypothetical protein [Asticcacaulis excentricus]
MAKFAGTLEVWLYRIWMWLATAFATFVCIIAVAALWQTVITTPAAIVESVGTAARDAFLSKVFESLFDFIFKNAFTAITTSTTVALIVSVPVVLAVRVEFRRARSFNRDAIAAFLAPLDEAIKKSAEVGLLELDARGQIIRGNLAALDRWVKALNSSLSNDLRAVLELTDPNGKRPVNNIESNASIRLDVPDLTLSGEGPKLRPEANYERLHQLRAAIDRLAVNRVTVISGLSNALNDVLNELEASSPGLTAKSLALRQFWLLIGSAIMVGFTVAWIFLILASG